ncbi:MAG: hypothetical protein RBU30_19965 [Polyangia bacterium]|jgi:hypothetical protein|nr:hypothetical protein [Polyangia bacterium]
MGTMVYFYTTSPVAPDFELDVVTSEKRTDSYTVTKYPIESGAKITDHVEDGGRKWSVEGSIHAMLPSDPAKIPGRLSSVKDALDSLAARKDAVTMVSGYDTRKVVIASWSYTHGTSHGDSLGVTMELEEVLTAGFAYTQIPPGRLMPKQARRSSPAAAKGGTASPKAAPTKSSSKVRAGIDRIRGR